MFVQVPEHDSTPGSAPHGSHLPDLQEEPDWHALPHAPQWELFDWTS
jgi:hypothetical protein